MDPSSDAATQLSKESQDEARTERSKARKKKKNKLKQPNGRKTSHDTGKKSKEKDPKEEEKKAYESSNLQQSEPSDESSSEYSDEIIVYETPENLSYERKVVLGHLSRVGLRESFWHDKIAAYFVALSYLITYDIVAHFFLFTHVFGIFWTFTYAFCMLFIGFPMCYLEMALGQYTSTGIYMVFDRISPAFVGVGVSALLINFFVATTDQTLFINALCVVHETKQILASQMPWHHCLSSFDIKYCHLWSRDCSLLKKPEDIPEYPAKYALDYGKQFQFVEQNSSLTTTVAFPIMAVSPYMFSLKGDTCIRPSLKSYYNGLMDAAPQTYLDKFKSAAMVNWANAEVHDVNSFKQYVYITRVTVLCTLVFIVLCIFIVSRSKRTVVTFLNVSLILTFCVLSFLLHGILSIFSPKFPNAVPVTVEWAKAIDGYGAWMCAVSLTMRSLKLGQGGLVFLGSQNGFHNNLIVDSLIITIAMIFIPFFYSLFHIIAVDSYVLEIVKGDPSQMEAAAGLRKQGTYHNPATIVTILLNANHIFGEYEPVVAFWYSVIMLCTVVSSKIVRYEITIGAFIESYVIFADESSRFILVVIVVLLTTLISLGFRYTDGYIRVATVNIAVVPIASSIVVLFELFVVGIFYGFRVFYSNTSLMIFGAGKTEAKKLMLLFNTGTLVLWAVVIPFAIVFLLIAYMVYDANNTFVALDMYNWILIAALLCPIPSMCIYLVYIQHSQGNSIYPLFKRNPDLWGPRSRANRLEAERAEKMIRKWW